MFWLQDVIGVASHRLLRRKLPVVDALVGRYYLALEARLLRRSDAVVPITDDFKPLLRWWGVAEDRVTTVENWAPLADLPVRQKDNPWAVAHGLAGRFVFLYTGTLRMKHNPEMLACLAEAFRERPEVVVVVSQGPGAEYLREQREARGLADLEVRGYEPLERVPDVMGATDMPTAIPEPEAGVFSVRSKVLSYLCAARPRLLVIPPENLAARIVTRRGRRPRRRAGRPRRFAVAAQRLLDEPETRAQMAAAARRYAEAAFDIEAITVRFEAILERVAA